MVGESLKDEQPGQYGLSDGEEQAKCGRASRPPGRGRLSEPGTQGRPPVSAVIKEERWATVWPEIEVLAKAHSVEVDGGVEPRRKFKIDREQFGRMDSARVIPFIIARQSGRMVGYFTWQVALDPESFGLLIGLQGAWFVEPG